jgi:hypothetical protein
VDFTYDAYTGFLEELRTRGYRTVRFTEPQPAPDEPYLLLHHDVDLDLGRAVAMAARERDHGWRATYFVMLTSPFYNPASSVDGARVRELVELGHDIGLHFDPTAHGVTGDDAFSAACRTEVEQLSAIADLEVGVVSFHRPPPGLVGGDPALTAPLPHTYQPRFVEEIEYCTDSTGRWRYGPPEERASVTAGRALHLLTHPIWWDDDDLLPEHRLDRFLSQRAARLVDEVAEELAVTPLPPTEP